MRMSGAWDGAACWPVCSVDHEHLRTGTGLGHGAGSAAGRGGGAALRPVSYPAGAGAHPSAGQRAGYVLLAVRHRRAVSLVAGGVGRPYPPVRCGGAAGGRRDLFSSVQRFFAEIGLSCRRFGHDIVPFGTFAHVRYRFPAEKNEKFCKKPLSLWLEMV